MMMININTKMAVYKKAVYLNTVKVFGRDFARMETSLNFTNL